MVVDSTYLNPFIAVLVQMELVFLFPWFASWFIRMEEKYSVVPLNASC